MASWRMMSMQRSRARRGRNVHFFSDLLAFTHGDNSRGQCGENESVESRLPIRGETRGCLCSLPLSRFAALRLGSVLFAHRPPSRGEGGLGWTASTCIVVNGVHARVSNSPRSKVFHLSWIYFVC